MCSPCTGQGIVCVRGTWNLVTWYRKGFRRKRLCGNTQEGEFLSSIYVQPKINKSGASASACSLRDIFPHLLHLDQTRKPPIIQPKAASACYMRRPGGVREMLSPSSNSQHTPDRHVQVVQYSRRNNSLLLQQKRSHPS